MNERALEQAEIRRLGEVFHREERAEHAISAGASLQQFKDTLLQSLERDLGSSGIAEWPYHFKLNKPKEVFGEMIDALDLKEPSSAVCVKFGVFDETVTGDQLLDMIAVLSGRTPATIRELPGTDMLRLSKRLMQVFTEAAQ